MLWRWAGVLMRSDDAVRGSGVVDGARTLSAPDHCISIVGVRWGELAFALYIYPRGYGDELGVDSYGRSDVDVL